ncbi:glycine cleavage system protein R [Kistimonas asteriae]|uniref:glycine cleavage system protein R n=1 Tax=Kistimonas asteriae TaxID=517724 RepID=UPI001BA67DC1|nr:ACT domain-containing protein [Kistimonas asteriae]
MNHFILTATGPDIPDIEEQLCNSVTQHHGHTIESNMSHMGGHFTGMMLFHIESQHTSALKNALKGVEQSGVHVEIEPSHAKETSNNTIAINVIADNSPELLSDIARILTEKHIRLGAVHTDTLSAPYTGEPLQRIQAKLFYPIDTSLDSIQASLESISPELMVEFLPSTEQGVTPQQHPA